MASNITFPEFLFHRLSESGPDIKINTLQENGYRQYVFLYSGNGTIEFDGLSEAVVPGTVLAIPVQVKCTLYLDKDVDGCWIAIQEDFLRAFIVPATPVLATPNSPYWKMYYSLSIRKEMGGPENHGLRDRIFQELLTANKRLGQGADPIVVGYIQLILFSPSTESLFEKSTSGISKIPKGVSNSELVLEFRQLVEEHFNEHWSIQNYCKHLGVTQRRLLFACKHLTGEFPKVIIHECLMREAKTHLTYSNMSISEIAYTLGFSSAAYFSRFYKRIAGVSPCQSAQRLDTRPQF